MSTIVPRWEWRSFGPSFPSAAAFVAELEGSAPLESDELYLLSAAGDNVKVRDDLMDIKVLRNVDGDGLEQWEPIMKAAFPLPAGYLTTRGIDITGVQETKTKVALEFFSARLGGAAANAAR